MFISALQSIAAKVGTRMGAAEGQFGRSRGITAGIGDAHGEGTVGEILRLVGKNPTLFGVCGMAAVMAERETSFAYEGSPHGVRLRVLRDMVHQAWCVFT